MASSNDFVFNHLITIDSEPFSLPIYNQPPVFHSKPNMEFHIHPIDNKQLMDCLYDRAVYGVEKNKLQIGGRAVRCVEIVFA